MMATPVRTLSTLLIAHVLCLVLAATDFSVVSWLWGDWSWTVNYFQYSYRHGWGYAYVSNYDLAQVLCYIVAYGLGVAAFGTEFRRHRLRLSAAGLILCALGVVSFCIEATHWLWRHHFSWIASFPVAMLVLWIVIGLQSPRRLPFQKT